MRHFLTLAVLAGAIGLFGCKKKPQEDLATLYPPPASELESPIQPAPEPPLSPEPVATVPPSALLPLPAPTGRRTYTIQPRDTLWSIARRYYGHGNRWPEIAQANPGIVPEKLRIGQTIVVP